LINTGIIINDSHLLGRTAGIKEQLLKDSRVVSATITRDVPVGGPNDGTQAYAKDNTADESRSEIHINKYHVDYDYLKHSACNGERKIFLPEFSDSQAVILNETAVKEFGIKVTLLENTLLHPGSTNIILSRGKRFHYASVKEKIAPLTMMLGNNNGGLIVK